MDTYPIFVILFHSPLIRDRCYSALLRYKTAKQSAFSSKSVKKSVKRGVRVWEKKNRIFSVSPQSRSLFSASFQTFCLTARAYLNTQKYGLFCSLLRYRNRTEIPFYYVTRSPIRYGYCFGAKGYSVNLAKSTLPAETRDLWKYLHQPHGKARNISIQATSCRLYQRLNSQNLCILKSFVLLRLWMSGRHCRFI